KNLEVSVSNVGGFPLKKLACSNGVASLDVSGSRWTDEATDFLPAMPSLRSANLSNTLITDRSLATLEKCDALDELIIYYTKITDAAVKKLQQARPNLKIER